MERKSKALLVSFVSALLLILCIGASIWMVFSGKEAYAQPSIEGTCHVKWRGNNVNDNVFFVTMPDGTACEGLCMDAGLPAAAEGDYPFSGEWNGSSYNIIIDATKGEIAQNQYDTGKGCQRVGSFTWAPKGKISLSKASLLPSVSDDNKCYSLAGAQYGVYQDSECTQLIATLTTDSTGQAESEKLVAGTYYVTEIVAPAGYAIDTAIYVVEVAMNETTQVNSGTIFDAPQSAAASLILQKIDAETQTTETLGGNSLEGAVFSVRYYDGAYQSAEEAIASGNPLKSWTLCTASDGSLSLSSESLVEGDTFYTNSLGETCLPLGSLVFEEIQAPEGYLLDSTPILVSLTSTGTKETDVSYSAPVVPNQVIRGDVEFNKAREDNQQRLSGIPFKITSLATGESHIIVTDENGYATTAADFNLHSLRTNANDALYQKLLAEQNATAGDTKNEEISKTNTESDKNETSQSDSPENDVYDGDIISLGNSTSKEEIEESESTTNMPSDEPGIESLVEPNTDSISQHPSSSPLPAVGNDAENGESSNTKSNQTTLDLRSGIWFGMLASEKMCPTSDLLGALPYGSYSIEELPCKANEGLELLYQPSVTISRNNYVVKLGTFDDQIEQKPTPTPEPTVTPSAETTPTPTTTPIAKVQDKTGVDLNDFIFCLAFISLAGCGLVAYGYRRCKKN